GDTTVVRLLLPALRDRDGAALGLVAGQAPAAVELDALLRRRPLVWVVARNAPEFPRAGLETAALVHLLDLPDRPRVRVQLRQAREHRPDLVQRQPRAEVERIAAAPQHPLLALQVALLAHRVARQWVEFLRVNDG